MSILIIRVLQETLSLAKTAYCYMNVTWLSQARGLTRAELEPDDYFWEQRWIASASAR